MTTFRAVSAIATQDNPLIQDLGNTLASSASAGLIVQSYCNQVLQQPDIIIPKSIIEKLPSIKQHLNDARDHSDNYLKNIQPSIIKVVTDVGGYSQQFTSFYSLISDRLKDWKGGDQSAKDDAIVLLKQLRNAVNEKKQNVTVISNDLSNFLTNVNQDVSNFNTASTKADTIIGGDQGELASLDKSISQLDTTISASIAGIAVSGLVVVGGGILIAVGSVANFITAGTSTPVIIAGVALVGIGIAGVTASSIILSKALDSKSDLLQRKAQLNANLILLKNFKSTMVQLSSAASSASTQINNMKNTWDFLAKNMESVISSLDNARIYGEIPISVQANLNTANMQWATVQQNVQTIQNQMVGVKTTVIQDGKGSLGTLNSEVIKKLSAA